MIQILKNMQGLLVLVTECLLRQSKQIWHIVCIKLKFSVYVGKLYDFFQRIFDLTAVADPA